MTKIVDFRVNFESILGSFWDPFWYILSPGSNMHTHTFFALHVCPPFWWFCLQLGTPLGTQKSHWEPPGGHWAPKNVFWKGFFTDLLFTWKLDPEIRTKSCVFWTGRPCWNTVNNESNSLFHVFSGGLDLAPFWTPVWVSFWHPF